MAPMSGDRLRKSIQAILKDADLNTLSSKKVRRQLEEKYEIDLTERKQEIDDILMSLITAGQSQLSATDGEAEAESEEEQPSRRSEESAIEGQSESEEDLPPPPEKKPKVEAKKQKEKSRSINKDQKAKEKKSQNDIKDCSDSDGSESGDAALARKLQEEELQSRSRAVKKAPSVNKRDTKKATSNKPQTKKGSTYSRKCVLSPELASVVGAEEMARSDVVKKMWSIVRERDLFDPSNKQYALCDEDLRKIFGTRRIRMFAMMKYLKNHVKDRV